MQTSSNTFDRTRLKGNPLTVTRVIWAVVTLLMAVLLVAAVPARFDQLRMAYAPGTDSASLRERLSADEIADLTARGFSAETFAIIYLVIAVAFNISMFAIGSLVFWKRSDDWLAMLLSLALIVYGPTNFYLIQSLPPLLPILQFPVDLAKGLSYALVGVALFVFPDGRLVPRRALPLIVLWIGWMLIWPFFPNTVIYLASWSIGPLFVALFTWFGAGLYAQYYRYQHFSTTTQRQQTKWVIFGFVLSMIGFVVIVLPVLFIPALTAPGFTHAVWILVSNVIFSVAVFIAPVTLCISILRYRLFDIDRLINRSIVYGILTTALVLMFLVCVLALQQVFVTVSGNQGSPLAVASAALLIGNLFQPARRRLQGFVDRRFYHLSVDLSRFTSTQPIVPLVMSSKLTGTQFGAYTVMEPLGRGGMSEVYKGRHTTLNRIVAIKILPAERAERVDFRTRFEREAQTVAKLRHPNIVQMFDFGNVDGVYYMAMEYISGQDLSEYIRDKAPMTLPMMISLLRDIASALDYAHSEGVVHRDVKPSNVMLQPTSGLHALNEPAYRAILMDFGIAKLISGTTGLTQTGTMGTLDYIAPEQILNSKDVDHRVDIYAFGVILYQMLTGQLPFTGANAGAIVFAHLQQPPPDPRLLMPTVSDKAAKAIERALAKDPKKRFNTAGEFIEALG